jgi:hypothetical protein
MEVLLAREQDKGVQFCEGLPLVPTLDEVSSWLTKERTRDAAAAGQAVRTRAPRATLTDPPSDRDDTFFMGKGVSARLSHGDTTEAMNSIGFFLYTQCDGNKGDMWPATMGAFCCYCV